MGELIFTAKDRYGANTEFEIKPLTRAVEMESDICYRKAYTESLKYGLFPREALRKMMRENGIWTEEHEKELKGVIVKIGRLEVSLDHNERAGDKEECLKVAGSLAKLRRRMWELALIQQSAFMNSSCEAYAEMIRIESQIAASVIVKANGQRYWKNYKEYVLERDTNETANVAQEAMKIAEEELSQRQREITENQPEQRWLKQFKLDSQASRDAAQQELKERVDAATNQVSTETDQAETDDKTTSEEDVAKQPE